jgi:pimeloyl-ACP methyl ester carboxylesterase
MKRALKWIVAIAAVLIVVVVLVAVGGSLLSLDWERAHATATHALPVFRGFGSDEVVRIPARGMEFRARIAGAKGDGVILLHGFPVTSAMWEPLLAAAADAGYRAVAFDQRGYSPDARPEGAASYAAPELIDDVMAVADAVGFERFHLVGHDWGSAVGWGVVLRHPERVLTWSSLSIPHPAAFLGALQDDPDQQRRSAYFRLFSTPWVPEIMFTFNGLAGLRAGVYDQMSPAQREEYLRVFAEPGALTAALNWYRAIPLSRASAADGSPEVTRDPGSAGALDRTGARRRDSTCPERNGAGALRRSLLPARIGGAGARHTRRAGSARTRRGSERRFRIAAVTLSSRADGLSTVADNHSGSRARIRRCSAGTRLAQRRRCEAQSRRRAIRSSDGGPRRRVARSPVRRRSAVVSARLRPASGPGSGRPRGRERGRPIPYGRSSAAPYRRTPS